MSVKKRKSISKFAGGGEGGESQKSPLWKRNELINSSKVVLSNHTTVLSGALTFFPFGYILCFTSEECQLKVCSLGQDLRF